MKLIGAAPAATFRRGLVAFALTTLALAGCSVDQPGQQPDKPTIRVGYQSFPSAT